MPEQRFVILGGSAGIGLAVAQAAAKTGAHVTIVSSSADRVATAVATLATPGAGRAVDLTNASAVRALFAQLGAFDHLVFTAGDSLLLSPLADLDLAAARRAFELRYWGALAAVQAAAPHVRSSITLTGGIAADRPRAGWSLGASVCSAMEGLTRALAVELAPIRVNLVSPGVVETELWAPLPADARAALYRDTAAALPVRHVGQPADVAAAYLALAQNRYITGQTLVVDGGGVLI